MASTLMQLSTYARKTTPNGLAKLLFFWDTTSGLSQFYQFKKNSYRLYLYIFMQITT